MASKVLLVVEGNKTETNLFKSVFERYGFKATLHPQKLQVDQVGQLDEYRYSHDGKSMVVIVEGPRNRIHGFLKVIENPSVSIERALSFGFDYFQQIFLIYDVDHNDCGDISKMFARFADESTGMLLLSSPCIEVLGDYSRERGEEKHEHLSEYKADINKHWNGQTIKYIVDHFEDIALHFLNKNVHDFGETNVMEHPRLIVEWINRLNTRVNLKEPETSYVIYRYYSTVVYVAIASAKSLTKEIENYEAVKEFFETEKSMRSSAR